MNKLSLLFTLVAIVFNGTILSQSEISFTEAALKEDILFFKNKIEQYCPALGVFHDSKDFETVYESVLKSIDGPNTAIEFHKKLNYLGAALHEGHLIISGGRDTSTNIYSGFFDGTFKFLPLSIRLIDNQVFVWANTSATSEIKRGDILIAINDNPIDSLMQELQKYELGDGDISNNKLQSVVQNFSANYYWFLEQPSEFIIKAKRPDSDSIILSKIPAITRDSMIAVGEFKYGNKEEPDPDISHIYTFKVLDDSIGIFTLKSFSANLKKKYKVNVKKLYKEIFKKLKDDNISQLIIDVRNNPGGRNEYTIEILPYLMKDDKIGQFRKATSWNGKVNYQKYPKKSKYTFEDKMYILTNSATFSNGSVLAAYGREYGEATIIGEETASRYEGFAAGSIQIVVLPNTKIPIGIPRYLIEYIDFEKIGGINNRGVIPDYIIQQSWDDYISNKDVFLEKAMSLIKG